MPSEIRIQVNIDPLTGEVAGYGSSADVHHLVMPDHLATGPHGRSARRWRTPGSRPGRSTA